MIYNVSITNQKRFNLLIKIKDAQDMPQDVQDAIKTETPNFPIILELDVTDFVNLMTILEDESDPKKAKYLQDEEDQQVAETWSKEDVDNP